MTHIIHQWAPWKQTESGVIRAGDEEWKLPGIWAEARPGDLVDVCCDPFVEWDGPIVGSKGMRLWWVQGEMKPSTGWHPDWRPVTMPDLRRDLFAAIDCTNLRYVLTAREPGNIREMWEEKPQELYRTPCDVDHRPNVFLMLRVSSQSELDAGIGDLLKCADLAPVIGVQFDSVEERVDLQELLGLRVPFINEFAADGGMPAGSALDWLRIVGPHNEHVDDLVSQCQEAGVPVWTENGPKEFPEVSP